MINKVVLRNIVGLDLEIPMGSQDLISPYTIRDIDGLGPVKVDISTEGLAQREGVAVQGIRTPERTLIFEIGLNALLGGSQSVQALRNNIYRWFNPGQEVRMTFMSTGFPEVEIVGICEDVIPAIFSEDPKLVASVICPDPYFSETIPQVSPAQNAHRIFYQGTAPTGLEIDVTLGAGITLFHLGGTPGTNAPFIKIPRGSIAAGDQYKVITSKGARSASYMRSGARNEVTGSVTRDSTWLMLEPGPMAYFQMYPSLNATLQLTYYNKYKGM